MDKPLWTSEAVVKATGGRALGGPFAAEGVSIDTRTLQPGDLFAALSGVRDGESFIPQALARGAAGVLQSRGEAAPGVVVADVQRALEALGVAARERATKARRCAVTGSVGKTSVTQALAAALGACGPCHSSVESYNNHIGVPLTLARMPEHVRFAVFELGMNHADEIRPLSRMTRPHVAVVTTVGEAHVENFPDGERGVARAKAEIFEGLEPDGTAVLNADNPWCGLLAEEARAHGARLLTFGRGEACDGRLVAVRPLDAGVEVEAVLGGRSLSFVLSQSGRHWGLNSVAVLLAVTALGASLEAAVPALCAFQALAGRGRAHRLTIRGAGLVLIDESYNANPLSMRAALAALGERPAAGRRIAALTDMLELGPEAAARHVDLAGALEAAGVDQAFLAGPLMRGLWDVLPQGMRGGWRETAEALAPEVLQAVGPGDAVVVKGSKGSKASLIVECLLAASRPPAAGAPEERG